MIKLIDVTFNANNRQAHVTQVFDKNDLINQYAKFLKGKMRVLFVKHTEAENIPAEEDTRFRFFKGLNKFWYIPFKSNRFIAGQNPDVVLVQGLGFPLQLMALRFQLGFKCKIIAQHHGEQPFGGFRLWCQQMAAHVTDGYIFSHLRDAGVWKRSGIINKRHQVVESLEASTYFTPADKNQCRDLLGLSKQDRLLLWVGRLDADKDPFTVLRAFKFYLYDNPQAKLCMIYQSEKLLNEINNYLGANPDLIKAVKLIGQVAHYELPKWYSAADYYLSASNKTDSGYALLEAMACGCVPIVTGIEAFKKITDDGKYGYLYEAGDAGGLYHLLRSLDKKDAISPQAILDYFKQKLSFQQIANNIYSASAGLCQPERLEASPL